MGSLISGAFGTSDQFGRVVNTISVLLLGAAGLVYTFNAGLYNLGIEGQITFGAIAATFAFRAFGEVIPGPLAIALCIVFGMVGGLLWGLLAGLLNVYGKISEIFAGLGMNFVAQGLAIFLIFGPWKRRGVACMSGTEPFNDSLWLGTFGTTEATPVGIALGLIAIIVTIIIMRQAYFGLKLRAVGRNLRASYILGIPATRQLLSAFADLWRVGGCWRRSAGKWQLPSPHPNHLGRPGFSRFAGGDAGRLQCTVCIARRFLLQRAQRRQSATANGAGESRFVAVGRHPGHAGAVCVDWARVGGGARKK